MSKQFNPQPGETYRLQAGHHYDERITITGIDGILFHTAGGETYDRGEFVRWLERRNVTVTKEETQ